MLTLKEKLEQALVPVEEQPYSIPGNWCWCRLATLADLYNGDRGKNYPSKKDYQVSGIPFINAGALNNGRLDESEFNFITEQKYNDLSSGKIMRNDILYCLRGSLGKMAFVDTDVKGAISSSLCILRAKTAISTKYLFYLLNADVIKKQQNLAEAESLLAIIHPQMQAKNQILKVSASNIAHEEVIGDLLRLQQVFVNIMGNAVKFTPEGGTISFSISEKPSRIKGSGCYEFVFPEGI